MRYRQDYLCSLYIVIVGRAQLDNVCRISVTEPPAVCQRETSTPCPERGNNGATRHRIAGTGPSSFAGEVLGY
ncbi:hypothetical protein BDZ91DRAFT_739239 [Kalaharituber pfeilii]|nr:hypothetical protein BDZ91DRAFT_739239 [Kalaharituber pfeilii]